MMALDLILVQVVLLMVAITVHEFAHGWVANKLGDPTAKYLNRLSLNPLAHIDPFGTILLPLILVMLHLPPVGWARPVPVNSLNLRNPKTDMFWVGSAGPAANFLMAILLSVILKIMPHMAHSVWSHMIVSGIVINLILGVFNLIPIPPLDGSRIVSAILPPRYAYAYDRIQPYGFIIIFFLLWSGILRRLLSILILLIVKVLGIDFSIY